MTVHPVIQWAGIITAFWIILSGVLNTLFYFRTPQEWVAFCERWPRPAAVFKIMRAMGVEPARALVAVKEFAQAEVGQRTHMPAPLRGKVETQFPAAPSVFPPADVDTTPFTLPKDPFDDP